MAGVLIKRKYGWAIFWGPKRQSTPPKERGEEKVMS